MSTNRRITDFSSAYPPLSIAELVELLAKHYKLASGQYDLGIEFHIGTGPVGPNTEELVPGVIIGVRSIGLTPSKVVASTDEGNSKDDEPSESAAPTPAKKSRPKKIGTDET